MKECLYCGTIYSDNLEKCPECGGRKVVSAAQQAEQEELERKEKENKERSMSTPQTKNGKLAGILVAAVVIIIVAVAVFSANGTSSSSGVSKSEMETAYEEAVTYYDNGDYESAITELSKVESTSKYYDEAQTLLIESIDAYREEILKTADSYADQEDYKTAMTVVEKAIAFLGNDDELSAAYQDYSNSYVSLVRTNAIVEADEAVAEGNYVTAIKTISEALDIIANDVELSALLDTYEYNFRSSVLAEAEAVFQSDGYLSAISVLNDNLGVLSDDSELNEAIEYYKEYTPVYLSDMGAWSKNKYLSTGTSNTSNLTDNYGTEYSPDRVIYNFGWTMFLQDPGSVTYYLNSQYSHLTGTIYVPYSVRGKESLETAYIKIYGDDNLIYEHHFSAGTDEPVDFDVNISGVEFLEVKVCGMASSYSYPTICCADLAVSK